MRDTDGDYIDVSTAVPQGFVNLELSAGGEDWYMELTSKQARKLARKLNQAARRVDGKQCRRGRQVVALQEQLAGMALELANAQIEIDHLQREAADRTVVSETFRVGDIVDVPPNATTTPHGGSVHVVGRCKIVDADGGWSKGNGNVLVRGPKKGGAVDIEQQVNPAHLFLVERAA